MRPKAFNALPPAKIRFIEPMYALALQRLPEGKDWLYEVKFDGYRCLAGRDASGVTLWSRRGNLFTAQFPHIARACERLPSGTLIDGEIVALDANGRVSLTFSNTTAPRRRRFSSMRSMFSFIVAEALLSCRSRLDGKC